MHCAVARAALARSRAQAAALDLVGKVTQQYFPNSCTIDGRNTDPNFRKSDMLTTSASMTFSNCFSIALLVFLLLLFLWKVSDDLPRNPKGEGERRTTQY
jgi:hypothetical protein